MADTPDTVAAQESMQPGRIRTELPEDVEPTLQPGSIDLNADENRFSTQEILWWNNGIWGTSGYAIPNGAGKYVTGNDTLRGFHNFIGGELFYLAHRDDVKLSRPPNGHWMTDLVKMIKLGIKRCADFAIDWGDKRTGDFDKGGNTPMAFTYYPVPYFGKRIRNSDIRGWIGLILRLLGEIQQHADNLFDSDVTNFSTAVIQEKLLRILRHVGMKYKGMTREQVEAPEFDIPADAFVGDNYQPGDLFTNRELVEELPPQQWWPSASDLTPIAGIPAPVAVVYGIRWPESKDFYGDGGGHEQAFPVGGTGSHGLPLVKPPTS